MLGSSSCPVRYLLSAGDPWRGDDGVVSLGSDGGEEPELANAHGQLVVRCLEAERAGHPAAAGVELGDLGAGDTAKQGRRCGGPDQRLLVAVAVEHDALAAYRVPGRQDEPSVGDC